MGSSPRVNNYLGAAVVSSVFPLTNEVMGGAVETDTANKPDGFRIPRSSAVVWRPS
jgi:hypothetical protein